MNYENCGSLKLNFKILRKGTSILIYKQKHRIYYKFETDLFNKLLCDHVN